MCCATWRSRTDDDPPLLSPVVASFADETMRRAILAELSTIPVLETERLRLRRHRVEDLADCLSLWGDPDVTRFIGGTPASEEEVWARILRYAGLWSLLGFGYWRIEEKASRGFVGEVGFA